MLGLSWVQRSLFVRALPGQVGSGQVRPVIERLVDGQREGTPAGVAAGVRAAGGSG